MAERPIVISESRRKEIERMRKEEAARAAQAASVEPVVPVINEKTINDGVDSRQAPATQNNSSGVHQESRLDRPFIVESRRELTEVEDEEPLTTPPYAEHVVESDMDALLPTPAEANGATEEGSNYPTRSATEANVASFEIEDEESSAFPLDPISEEPRAPTVVGEPTAPLEVNSIPEEDDSDMLDDPELPPTKTPKPGAPLRVVFDSRLTTDTPASGRKEKIIAPLDVPFLDGGPEDKPFDPEMLAAEAKASPRRERDFYFSSDQEIPLPPVAEVLTMPERGGTEDALERLSSNDLEKEDRETVRSMVKTIADILEQGFDGAVSDLESFPRMLETKFGQLPPFSKGVTDAVEALPPSLPLIDIVAPFDANVTQGGFEIWGKRRFAKKLHGMLRIVTDQGWRTFQILPGDESSDTREIYDALKGLVGIRSIEKEED